jgi:hypothetical protein
MTTVTELNPKSLPPSRMVWVTWRQHRIALICLAALSVAACTGLLVNGLWTRSFWRGPANLRMVCVDANFCGVAPFFTGSPSWYGPSILALHLVPVVIGMFLGAPLLTREFDQRTGEFAWSQGIGALRWTLAKVTLLAGAAMLAVLPIGLLFAWWYPIGQYALDSNLSWPVTHYDLFPAPIVRWTLFAVVLGALIGALIRRTVAAIAATGLCHALLLTGTLMVNYQPEVPPSPLKWQFTEGDGLLLITALLVLALVWRVRATLEG